MARGMRAPARRPAAVSAPALRVPRWSAAAWGTIGLTAALVALTCWWLAQDEGVPSTEPGAALYATLQLHDQLSGGDLLAPLTFDAIHPPLLQLVGAIGMLVGGVGVTPAVLAQTLVFMPLLALGCYQTAKLWAGPTAGLLAAAFALGSPLIVEQFHTFMVDAPDAALVAVTVWLVLASGRFADVRTAALAGVAAGLGIATKQQFAFFLVGLLAVVLLREQGWRNRRGLLAFAGAGLAVGAPWYLAHLGELAEFTRAANESATPGTMPDRLSLDNLGWYVWSAMNSVLFLPLFAFAVVGVGAAIAAVARRSPTAGVAPELLGGLGVAWLALMITPIHVARYLLPAIVYLAVLGTVWIVRLPRTPRIAATAALALALCASVLGAGLGVGGPVRVTLVAHPAPERGAFGIPPMDRVVVHTDENFLVSAPQRDARMHELFAAMKRAGVAGVTWLPEQTDEPRWFDHYGLDALAAMERLATIGSFDPAQLPERVVLLTRTPVGAAPPCVTLGDERGVWLRLGRALDPATPNWCPLRRPAYYGP